MKKTTPEHAAQLLELRDRILLTVEFLDNHEGLGEFGQALCEAARTNFAKGDLRSMRLIARQVDAFTIGLPAPQLEGLDAILRERLCIDKDTERRQTRAFMASILERGTIASEKQRRKVEDYLEGLQANNGDPAEIEAIKRLLQS